MYRLKIDLRAGGSTLNEEHDFDSQQTAEAYYNEVRKHFVSRVGRVESRSSISHFLGGSQAQFWSVCKHFEENVKREYVWWKK
jgi:hypothetical protein